MSVRASIGVLRSRLYASRGVIALAIAAAAIVAAAAPDRTVAPFAFGALLGIAVALNQTPGHRPHLDRCEQSAPLFGRELARAKALVPCIAAVLAVAVYTAVQLARGGDEPSTVLAFPPSVAAALVAMSATVRRGATRRLYVLMACAVSIVSYGLANVAHSIVGELAFCLAAAFLGLRQYGETLARYDPV